MLLRCLRMRSPGSSSELQASSFPLMEHHFLFLSYIIQGHINPSLRLAKRLARATGAAVTFSTAVSAHRRMFPELATPDQEVNDGLLTYIPHSDGFDDGDRSDLGSYASKFQDISYETASAVVRALAERGRPVTCIIHTLACFGDVARDRGIPSVFFWLQPATVFAIFHHYFHGYDSIISSNIGNPSFAMELPGVPPLTIREIPSILTATTSDPVYFVRKLFQDMFKFLDLQKSVTKPKVLLNSFDELEADGLAAIGEVEMIAVGPLASLSAQDDDALKPEERRYMEWLNTQAEKSVVYVSFGSLAVLKERQVEEIRRGLETAGRPYLWVLRKDKASASEEEEEETARAAAVAGKGGMVVEWCSQVRVLSHAAVGCFVTHGGWNSTAETLACGVPAVGVPQWMEQAANAKLMEIWGVGVRAEVGEGGVLEAEELRRCVETVMGEGERGKEMRRRAEAWKAKAQEAVSEGGSSDRNLKAFVDSIEAQMR